MKNVKLYTEKQLRIAIMLARKYYDGWTYDEENIFAILTHIELPSDDEIKEEVLSDVYIKNDTDFINGAKWVIDQIKQQDNGN